MSTNTSIPDDLSSIQEACRESKEITASQITIVCSPYPEVLLSGALLCKSILKKRKLFQVTYTEPVISFESFNTILKSHPDSIIILIGVTVEGTGKIHPARHPIITISGEIKSRSSKITRLDFRESISLLTYAFAQAHYKTGNDELTLAAIGTLLQENKENTLTGANLEITNLAIKNKLLTHTKGFKLFSRNTSSIYDTLFYSIHPYLPDVSGEETECSDIIENSDIPFSKRNLPLDELTQTEVQKFTQQLITRIDPLMTSSILGPDFVLLRESTESPLRYLSNLSTLTATSWARRRIGESFAVWLGDRARALRNILDSHMIHCSNVLSGIKLVKDYFDSEDSSLDATDGGPTILPPLGINKDSLSDVGRIAITYKIPDNESIVLQSESSIDLVLSENYPEFTKVLRELVRAGIPYSTTSKRSLRIDDVTTTKLMKIQDKLVGIIGGG